MRIGVDLGGTKISVVAMHQDNTVLARSKESTPKQPQQVYQAIDSAVNEVARVVGAKSYSVGISMPGTIDRPTYILAGTDPVAEFKNLFGDRVKIANDANCFALAESRFGAGRGANSLFGVILGTGVGGGIVINNQLYEGANGLAGEWGHNTVRPTGNYCWCGHRGCVETEISGTALETHYYQLCGQALPAKNIFDQDTPTAKEVLDHFFNAYGQAVASVVNFFDPEVIVLGGGLSNQPSLYTRGTESVVRHVFATQFRTRIVPAQLGDDAGVIGATLL